MLIDRLRRVTRDGRWLPEIDGLRFIAISSVLVFHMTGELQHRGGREVPLEPQFGWLWRLIHNGDRGVALFFVISGMILALPFARSLLLGAKPVSLRKFYLRRVTRLEPPYVLCILLCAVMNYVYSHGHVPGMTGHLLATMFYQHNIIYGEMSPLDMVTWSLEVEIQFYLFAPLFMQVYRLRGTLQRRAILLFLIAAIGLMQLPFSQLPRFSMSILFYLQYFLTGLLVADVFVLDLERMKTSWWWDVAGLSALVAMFWIETEVPWQHAAAPFSLALLCIAAMRSVVLRRFLAAPWIAVIGGMCYSIYLWHFMLIAALFKVTRRLILGSVTFPVNLAIQMIVTVAPVLVLCVLYFVLVERPCMDPDWPSKLWHRLTGRPEQDVAGLDSAGISEGK